MARARPAGAHPRRPRPRRCVAARVPRGARRERRPARPPPPHCRPHRGAPAGATGCGDRVRSGPEDPHAATFRNRERCLPPTVAAAPGPPPPRALRSPPHPHHRREQRLRRRPDPRLRRTGPDAGHGGPRRHPAGGGGRAMPPDMQAQEACERRVGPRCLAGVLNERSQNLLAELPWGELAVHRGGLPEDNMHQSRSSPSPVRACLSATLRLIPIDLW
jgi:hypothetical protein